MIKVKKDNLKEEAEKEIANLKEEVSALTANWKRALADYQNLERRTMDEKINLSRFAARELLKKLLPVLDTLEKANDVLKDEGLALVIKQFISVLKEENVSEIITGNADFNPEIMECISVIKSGEENKVAETLEKGYLIGDSVLRPAKVVVTEKVSGTPQGEQNKENQN